MKSSITNKSIIVISAAVIFYVISLFFSDYDQLYEAINRISFEYMPIIFGLVMINNIVYGIRFHILLKNVGIDLNFKQSLLIFLSGLTFIITPGTAGSLIKSYILKNNYGYSFSKTSPIIFFERWLELISIVIMIGILLIWYNFIESQIILIIGITFSIIFYLMLSKGFGISFINKIGKKISIFKNFSIENNEFKNSFSMISKLKNTSITFSLTMISKLISLLAVFLIFESFNVNFDIFQSGQVFFTSQLIGIMSLLPGGVLVTESSLTGIILKQGIDFGTASLLVLTLRFFSLWINTILGSIILSSMIKIRNN